VNNANNIYMKHWVKMSKLIATISDAIKDYYKTSGEAQLPDHEVVLMSMQLFSLICGKKWGYNQDKLEHMWVTSIDVHRLVQAATVDVKTKGKMQEYVHSTVKQYNN
jgi:hypothetical protein